MTNQQPRSTYLLLLTLAQLSAFCRSLFCTPLNNNTFAGFVQTVTDSDGFALLCPFEISGDRCSGQEYPNGFPVTGQSDLIIVCDPFLHSGYNPDSECRINCPGRHFTVDQDSSLTLDSIVLQGATNSSIQVEQAGKLSVINSIFNE